MIPKIIHACWLGDAPMPQKYKEYMDGWRKTNPDFEIKLWTDKEFSKYYDDSLFVKDCLEKKKYGFLSDYFRFTVLYEFGGIYIDTDIEVFKSLNKFLNCKMFMGFFIDSSIGTALYGSEPNNPLMLEWKNKLLKDYEQKGTFTVSNDWITEWFITHYDDFKLNGKRQSLKCGIELWPKDYFERYQINKKKDGGYAEHHCDNTWKDEQTKTLKSRIKNILPRGLVSYLGHKLALREKPFYDRYKKDRKFQ